MGLRSRIRYYRKKHKVFLTHLVLLEGNIREECKREDGVGEVKVDRKRQMESVGPLMGPWLAVRCQWWAVQQGRMVSEKRVHVQDFLF